MIYRVPQQTPTRSSTRNRTTGAATDTSTTTTTAVTTTATDTSTTTTTTTPISTAPTVNRNPKTAPFTPTSAATTVNRNSKAEPTFTSSAATTVNRNSKAEPTFTSSASTTVNRNSKAEPTFTPTSAATTVNRNSKSEPTFTPTSAATTVNRNSKAEPTFTPTSAATTVNRNSKAEPTFTPTSAATTVNRSKAEPTFTPTSAATTVNRNSKSEPTITTSAATTVNAAPISPPLTNPSPFSTTTTTTWTTTTTNSSTTTTTIPCLYDSLPKIRIPNPMPLYNLSEHYSVEVELPDRYNMRGLYTVNVLPEDNPQEEGHPLFFYCSSNTVNIEDNDESMKVSLRVRDDCVIRDIPEIVKFRYYSGTFTEKSVEERDSGTFNLYMFQFAKSIFTYFPSNRYSTSPVNILLAGLTGSTKSSFGNSIVTAIHQHPTDLLSPFRSGGGESHVTVKLERMQIPQTCINIWDMWGFSENSPINYDVLWQIIDGQLPSRWDMDKIPEKEVLDKGRATAHTRKIHAIVFFIPQGLLNDPNQERILSSAVKVWKSIKDHTRDYSTRGLPMFLLISKVDEVMPHARTNPESLQNDVTSLKNKAYESFDATEFQVHFNINYTKEMKKTHVIDRLNLSLFLNYLQSAERYRSER